MKVWTYLARLVSFLVQNKAKWNKGNEIEQLSVEGMQLLIGSMSEVNIRLLYQKKNSSLTMKISHATWYFAS